MNFFQKKIMGILNLTPDSFYDGGSCLTLNSALLKAQSMLQEGAFIIDVGGESTKPGVMPVSLEEEQKRVIPVIKALIKQIPSIFLSIDTYKPQIADEALSLGAQMLNDITGLSNLDMIQVAKKHQAFVVLMHMHQSPQNMQENPLEEKVVLKVLDFFQERVEKALSFGIQKNKIILDPGIGFGKTPQANLDLIKASGFFQKKMGLPVLIGASRKSVIGHLLSHPELDRKNGSVIVHLLAFLFGAHIVRVHDVKESFEALKILDRFELSSFIRNLS